MTRYAGIKGGTDRIRYAMLRDERLDLILQLVNQKRAISVEELISQLGISPSTARRDLDYLADNDLLTRTRGGARAIRALSTTEQPQRYDTNAVAKAAIARYAIGFLHPGDTIGVTGGSTVLAFIEQLMQWASHQENSSDHILTVVTNSIEVAARVGRSEYIRSIIIGGAINRHSLEVTGPFSIYTLNQLSLDMAFVGVNGIDENGPGTVNEYEAVVNQMIAARSRRPFIMADSSKFGRPSFSSIGTPMTVPEIITDSYISGSNQAEYTALGYKIHIAPITAIEDEHADTGHRE